MKKLVYIAPLLLCASTLSAKSFGNGFAWGSFAGFTAGMIANEAHRYQQPCRPSLYIMHPPKPQKNIYVVSESLSTPVACCTSQECCKKIQPAIAKDHSPIKAENKRLKLEIIKEENRKKELALREKELDIQILKLRQV